MSWDGMVNKQLSRIANPGFEIAKAINKLADVLDDKDEEVQQNKIGFERDDH